MVQSKSLWLFGLAATAVSAKVPATTSDTQHEYFYGKNSISKLHVNKVVTEKNCGCTGSWNSTDFADVSHYFGAKLDELLPKKTTTARGHKDASPLSIGSNTYTLSLDYSSNYTRHGPSNAAVWSRLISEMLVVANHTLDRSILIGEYINVLGGSHNLTLTVYGDKSCVNKFDPCVKPEPAEAKIKSRSSARVGPALDWSDKDALIKHLNLEVYNASSFEEAALNNKTLPKYIYLEGHRGVVDTDTIKLSLPEAGDSKLHGRQLCTGVGYDSYAGEGLWSTWGDWLPVSSCLWTGLSPTGGSQSFNVGFSMSYAQSFSWGWSPIKSIFTAMFTFSVTETYSESFTYSCTVPGNSVGQIWARQYLGSGYVYKTSCYVYCGVKTCTRSGPNYASAPSNGAYAIGCSTGSDNMACKAYQNNWIAYNVWTHTPAHST